MSTHEPSHTPVLLNSVLTYALPENGKIFADLTFGLGGHSRAILEKFPELEKLVAIDRDNEILNYSCKTLNDPRISRFQAKASDLKAILSLIGIPFVDGILLDLGVSSWQLDNAERGFSFSKPGPLGMRMNQDSGETASDLINNLEKSELKSIFFRYGEEKFSKSIAEAICRERKKSPITTTDRLAGIVTSAIPKKFTAKSHIHPATRVFQALRIAVNQELEELEAFLETSIECLNPGGYLCIISFHSLEDRIVKKFFQQQNKGCICPPYFPVCTCKILPKLEILTKKPIFADEKEKRSNPRSRSARLRAAKKIERKP
jgi:16S rRNA (cytosine1402-N4)-methyltransferase